MIKIKIMDKDPSAIMGIVQELREQGLVQGTDFDFSYCPPRYNNDGWAPVTPKHTIFVFYEDKYATLFSLRYSS